MGDMKIGPDDMSKCYIGTAEVQKIYVGADLIWQNVSLVPFSTTLSTVGAGSYTVPAGCTEVTVHCIGGGAGGPGLSQGFNFGPSATGGSGGGAYARRTFAVTPGQVISYNVGNAGAAGGTSGSGQPGGVGGTSWFLANGSTGCVAVGGNSGTAAINGTGAGAGGSSASCIGDQVYRGGNAGNRTLSGSSGGSGAGGGGAGFTGQGGDASQASGTVPPGGTGNYPGGNGGACATPGNNPGNPYGGGASGTAVGAFGTSAGDVGAQGVIIVEGLGAA